MEGVVSVHGKGMEEVTVALGKNLGKQDKNLVVPNSILLSEISKLVLCPPICPRLSAAYTLLNRPMTALSQISATTTTPNVAL